MQNNTIKVSGNKNVIVIAVMLGENHTMAKKFSKIKSYLG
jgi:hypothetical protein